MEADKADKKLLRREGGYALTVAYRSASRL